MEYPEVIGRVASNLEADIYVYAGGINQGIEHSFNECVKKNKTAKSVVLILTTLGGSADAAYQMVRSLQNHYQDGKFTLFVPSLCKSAGTLIALGASSIVMLDMAELGPPPHHQV